MKNSILFTFFLLFSLSANGQARWNQKYQDYVDRYKDIAITQMQRYNIPASITLAQGILESGAGDSELALYGNNHFGIKCHDWTGRTMKKDDDRRGECFRVYDNPEQSYEDHSLFLVGRSRYSVLFTYSITDYVSWARGLKSCGYATNPKYADLLIGLIETYNLSQYDVATPSHKKGGSHSQPSMVAPPKANKYSYKMINGLICVIAHRYDTFARLERETGIKAAKLAKYNERGEKEKLSEGDIIFLKKKKKRLEGYSSAKYYIAKSGDSMYSISQKNGIRLKSLYKLNGFKSNRVLRVGDKVRLN